jgi:peptide/nickel transport system substrate-binding protein
MPPARRREISGRGDPLVGIHCWSGQSVRHSVPVGPPTPQNCHPLSRSSRPSVATCEAPARTIWGYMRRAPLTAIALCLPLIAAACTGGAGPRPAPAHSSPPLPRGGTLRVGQVFLGAAELDPQAIPTSQMQELNRCCLVRTLMSYTGHSTAEGGTVIRPDLAAGLPEVSPDGLTWTFHLKRGIHYAPPLQNVEITAADFVRSIERMFKPYPSFGPQARLGFGVDFLLDIIQGARAYAVGKAASISGVDVPDPYTLRIQVPYPVGDLPYRLAAFSILPIPANPYDPSAELGVAEGHDGDYGYFMVATGPYMIEGAESIDLSQPPVQWSVPFGLRPNSITLVRNPSWDPATDDLRRAYLDRIVFTPMDYDEAVGAVERGDVDVVFDAGVPPEDVERYSSTPTLKDRILTAPQGVPLDLYLNAAIPPFDDLYVRRALNFALDKARTLAAFLKEGPNAVTADHLFADSAEENLLLNYHPYGMSPDLKAARAEMAQSRYDADHDGTCDASACSAIRLLVRGDLPERVAAARIIRDDLRPLGIRLRLDAADFDDFFSTLADPLAHLPLVIAGSSLPYPSASSVGSFLLAGCGSGTSTSCSDLSLVGATPKYLRQHGYSITKVVSVDDRIRECQAAVFETAVRCWAVLDQYAMERVVPVIPLLTQTLSVIVSNRVRFFSLDEANGTPFPALDQFALFSEGATEPPPAEVSPSPFPTTAPPIPEGTYRLKVTMGDAERFGVSEEDVPQVTGTFTLTLSAGHWRLVQVGGQNDTPLSNGVFYGSGGRVTFLLQTPPADALTFTLEWRARSGEVIFRVIEAGDRGALPFLRAIYQSHPWTRTG